MNDDLTLLASAYLDGDVTADERAVVEADTALLVEVERLRSVRALLSDVEVSSISKREAQLAAALGAWDRLPAPERTGATRDATPGAIERGVDPALLAAAGAVTAPARLSSRRRNNPNRRLLGAAAAIMLVLAGGIAAQSLTGGDSDESSSVMSADVASSAPEVAALAEPAQAPSNRAADSAEAAVEGGAEAGAEFDTGIGDVAPPGDAALEQLNTPEELGIFAADAVSAPTAPDVPAATSAPVDKQLTETQAALADAEWPLCRGVDFVVGPARYRDVEVVVGVDDSRDLAIAYQVPGCQEVARVRLP